MVFNRFLMKMLFLVRIPRFWTKKSKKVKNIQFLSILRPKGRVYTRKVNFRDPNFIWKKFQLGIFQNAKSDKKYRANGAGF